MINSFPIEDPRYFSGRQLRAEREISSQLRSQLFFLWTFIASQDLWEDALDFMDEHCDLSAPFDFYLSD